MNNMSVYHQDDGYFRFLFSLQDGSKTDIKIGATVKIRIVNDLGVEVYKNTFTVTEQDYSQWENRYFGTSWLAAAIYINETDITAGQVDEGTFYYQVTASDGARFDEFTLDIDNLPTKEETFTFNENWVVNGEWEFTIVSVEEQSDCRNQNNGSQYVLITFKYKNIGHTDTMGLSFSQYDFSVYDSTGNLASSYSCYSHTKSSEDVDFGMSHTASAVVKLSQTTQQIKIVVKKHDSNYNPISATFTGSVTACAHDIVTEKGHEATCSATGVTDYKYCSKCGDVLAEKTTLPKIDHTWSIATCSEARKCTVCKYSGA